MTRKNPGFTIDEINRLKTIWNECAHHREKLLAKATCGCFYCKTIFDPLEITNWCDKGQTAICPHCGIDSVLPEDCGAELNEKLLSDMNKIYF